MSAGPEPRLAPLLAGVRRLEIAARRNAAGLLAGDYPTAVPGRGLLFRESRKYVPGEPVRSIDWNTTARLGEPYVKVHHEERRRDVFLAVDVSPSMHVGFVGKTKLELAVELAATLAASAVHGGDRVGWAIFADRLLDHGRPRGGGRQLFRFLSVLLRHTAPWRRPVAESDPRVAIQAIERHRGRRFVVFLISDFIDHDLPEDLKYLRARHDVSLLHVYDPVEYESGAPVAFVAGSPERHRARGRLTPGETGSLEEMTRSLRERCARHRIATASFACDAPVPAGLRRFFWLKRRQVVR
ncbi:MAG: DUF58 domain-containing protein [Thermoanaerobaculia bacterium]|nr:DUF58 domain-containing protein [Thermoanaerobaculia bacterium]